MTLRTRLVQFLKRTLRVGQASDGFFSGRGASAPNSGDAGRADFEAHTRGIQGGL